MPVIVEVNGYDFVGKDYVIQKIVAEHPTIFRAPRVSELFLPKTTLEERIAFYREMSADKYAEFHLRCHVVVNQIALNMKNEGRSIIINRGYNIVIADTITKYMLRSRTFDDALASTEEWCQTIGFQQIGDCIVNLDLQGTIEEVMNIVGVITFGRKGNAQVQVTQGTSTAVNTTFYDESFLTAWRIPV